jgi:hypothetical protein
MAFRVGAAGFLLMRRLLIIDDVEDRAVRGNLVFG